MSRLSGNGHNTRGVSEELERQLVRLADGELSADDRRRLLKRLDELPDGWRRCALVFLENQAFAVDFPAVMAPPPPPAPSVPTTGPRWLPWTMAVAASWFAMFVLGSLWQSGSEPAADRDSRPVGLPPAVERLLVREQWGESNRRDRRGSTVAEPFAAPPPWVAERALPSERLTPERQPSGMLSAEMLSAEMLAAEMLSAEQLPRADRRPPDMLEWFRDQGLEPKVLDSYVPVQLKDGRRIIIPK